MSLPLLSCPQPVFAPIYLPFPYFPMPYTPSPIIPPSIFLWPFFVHILLVYHEGKFIPYWYTRTVSTYPTGMPVGYVGRTGRNTLLAYQ